MKRAKKGKKRSGSQDEHGSGEELDGTHATPKKREKREAGRQGKRSCNETRTRGSFREWRRNQAKRRMWMGKRRRKWHTVKRRRILNHTDQD